MSIMMKDLGKVFLTRTGSVVALTGVSGEIRDGEFVSLVGPSGCGKSTFLNIIAGLLEPTEGEVLVNGYSPGKAPNRPGIVFQSPVLLPWCSATDNVLLPAKVGHKKKTARTADREMAKCYYEERALKLLRFVGLEGFEKKYSWELSGGMQQRVALARALLLETNLLLLDEPFSALDEFTRETMNFELLRIWSQQHLTAVFVTHNIFEAVFLSDRVIVMTPRPGKIVGEVSVQPASSAHERNDWIGGLCGSCAFHP